MISLCYLKNINVLKVIIFIKFKTIKLRGQKYTLVFGNIFKCSNVSILTGCKTRTG